MLSWLKNEYPPETPTSKKAKAGKEMIVAQKIAMNFMILILNPPVRVYYPISMSIIPILGE
jgi:hypothetical protein